MDRPLRRKRPTILDVAAAASVSDATVSRAMAGDPAVRESTRQKVLAAALKLGYRPNVSARGLKMGSIGALGVFCEGGTWMFYNDYYGQLLAGLAEEAGADGVRLVFYFSEIEKSPDLNPHHNKIRLRGLEALADGRVDGGVVVGGDFSDRKTTAMLRKEGFPLVALGPDRVLEGYAQMGSGVASRMRLAAGLLAAQGHRKLAFLGLAKDSTHNQVCEEVLKDLGRAKLIDLDPKALIYPATYELLDPIELRPQLERALSLGTTALLVSHVDQAAMAQDLLEAMGKRVPQDISLLSFGYEPPSLRARPRHLSLIQGNMEESGRRCYRLFKEVLEGKKPAPAEIAWTWTPNGQTLAPAKSGL